MKTTPTSASRDGEPRQVQLVQGFVGEVRGYLTRDGEYLTIVLPGVGRVTKHRNWFLALLGLPFTPKRAKPDGSSGA